MLAHHFRVACGADFWPERTIVVKFGHRRKAFTFVAFNPFSESPQYSNDLLLPVEHRDTGFDGAPHCGCRLRAWMSVPKLLSFVFINISGVTFIFGVLGMDYEVN